MWISKDDFISRERLNAGLQATVESNIATIKRLETEIAYWRNKFESAQNRADRVADLAFETGGLRPISDLGVAEQNRVMQDAREASEKLKDFATEMYADSLGEDSDELPAEGFTVDPELIETLTNAMKEIKG